MKPKRNKDSNKNPISQEQIARTRATNSILDQYKKVQIIQFLNIGDNSLHTDFAVDIDEPLFQPEPKVILFTDYEPLQIRTQILKLLNRDKVPRRVSIVQPENRLFQVTPYHKHKKNKNGSFTTSIDVNNTKVAPGMEVAYNIKFTPEAKVDVSYDLIVITEREKFIVPIRGIGCKVMLEFMDRIDFGEVPVKYKIEKPIILRNVGEKITKWMLKCSSTNISVSKKEGILDIGKSEQIICTFSPEEARYYKEQMLLTYDEFEAPIWIEGCSKNDDVELVPRSIKLEDAYITLHSQYVVEIHNKTSVPIEFVWKQHPSKEKEDEIKKQVFENLNRQEAEEKILNELQVDYEEVQGAEDTSIDLEDSYDEEEKIQINERNHAKSVNEIARKFEKIKKSLNEDQMFYENPNFQIEPLTGKIWPNTKMVIGITFKPEKAILYKSEAYCDVTGLEKRLRLDMSGMGIGPKAKLNFYEHNLLDRAITSEYKFTDNTLVITNIGVIDCEFVIEAPNTPCAKQFKFGITQGVLKPRGEKESGEMAIPITFHAERLGEFTEKFLIKILKSGAVLPVVFKGHVIAPFCRFSEERIDFGKVSLGFPRRREIELINESDVSIKYRLRISTDSKDINQINTIFIITPIQGIIEKKERKKIEIEFKPESERGYEIVVLMDMEDIGYDMLTLPVTAICEIPEVIIDPTDELNFEKVYIRAETIKTIKLINTSSTLNAQFQILPQDETSKTWGVLTCQTDSGKIGPEETYNLNVCLVPNKLGPFRLKLEILCKTKNNMGNTTTINIKAHSIGPTIRVDKNLDDLDFGNIHVLNTRKDRITLVNDNPIDATYTAFMKNVPNIFSIVNKSGVIPKKSMIDLEILCRPDEAMRFAELLYIKVDEAEDIKITLKAKGEGTTIVIPEIPDTNSSTISFGTIFTSKEHVKEIRFENRGRSKQIINWIKKIVKKNIRLDDKARSTQNNNNNNNKNKQNEEEEKKEVFTLARKGGPCLPKSYCFFKLLAFSQTTGTISESFQIQNYKDGESSGGSPTWDNVIVTAEFINPSLDYPKKLFFTYSYDKDSDVESIKNNLTIKNIAKLQAQFMITVNPPFSISKDKFTIEPNECDTLEVEFDPSSYKIKKEISNFVSKLFIQHTNHEQLETIDLVGKINFPNLTIIPTKLDFGCLLNDTFKKNLITLENESEMDVVYEWFLVEEENSYEPLKNKRREGRRIPLNEVFGIVPMNGKLKKGEKEITEISFSPGMNQKYYAKAKCCVEGGPEYIVDLVGEASEIKYKIVVNDQDMHDMNKREFNILFGEIPFNERSKIDMVIKNDGDVPFVYRINYNSDKLRYLSISSVYDEIKAKDFRKIEIEIIPGIPDFLDDELIIDIAHFEPIKVRIKAIGIYRGVVFLLNRKEHNFKELIAESESRLETRKKKMGEYIPNYLIKKSVNLNKKVGLTPGEKKNNLVQNAAVLNVAAEGEMEFNRDILCKRLVEKMNKFEIFNQQGGSGSNNNLNQNNRNNTNNNYNYRVANSGAMRETQLNNFMKDIKISTYTLEFGNIVAGKKVDLKFDINNFNKTPVSFSIERKELANLGYIITNQVQGDKFTIDPFSYITLYVTHETSTRSLNNNKNIMKLTMKDGEVYEVELNSFVAVPDLKLSLNEVKFDKVYIGRKKIMRFRIENITKVPVRWNIINKDPASKKNSEKEDKKDDSEIFTISPMSDKLEPGKKKTITVSFVPQKAKNYKSKYEFIIDDNPRHIEFFLDGSGAELELKIIPETLNIGPVLPYYKYALDYVELHNPNDIDIEVYSLDFNEDYLQEEEMIRYYYSFIKHPNSSMDLPIRNSGEHIWKKFANYHTKLSERLIEAKNLKTEENEVSVNNSNNNNLNNLNNSKISNGKILSEKERLIDKIEIPEIDEEYVYKIQPKIENHLKYNIILLGPEKSGVSTVLREQRKFQYRGVVNMKNIFEWNIQNEFKETIEKVRLYQEEKKKELEFAKVEREKALKQAKAKKQKIDETPIDEKKFLSLSKELMTELIKNRLSQPDCNVGAVFDNFHSDLVESNEVLLEILEELLKNENLILAYIEYPQDDNSMEICNYIDWKGISEHYQKEKIIKRQNESAIVKNEKDPIKKSNTNLANNINSSAINTANKGAKNAQRSSNINNPITFNSQGTNLIGTKTGGKDSAFNTANKEKEKLNTTILLPAQNRFDSLSVLNSFYMGVLNIPNALEFSSPKVLTQAELEEYFKKKSEFAQKFEELSQMRDQYNQERIENSDFVINSDDKFFNKSLDDDISKNSDNINFNASNFESNKFENSQNNLINSNNINASNNNFGKMDNNNIFNQRIPVERKITAINFEYYLPMLLYNFCKAIPNPKLPDPEDLPLPPDEEFQIIKRPGVRTDRTQITSFFLKALAQEFVHLGSVEEIVNSLIEEDKKVEELKSIAAKDKAKAKPAAASKNVKDAKNINEEIKAKEILTQKSRWIIKKGESVKVLVGFFCKEVAIKFQAMSFEIMTYPPKEFKLNLTGISDYPSLSTIPSNIFMNRNRGGAIGLMNKKKNYEEDFGYILITKDSERKNIEKYKDTNCRMLRFTNNGKFDLRVDFVFLSSLNTDNLGFNLFLGSNTDGMNASHTANMKPKNAQPQVVEPPTPFLLTSNFLEIKKEETKLLQVYTFPQRTVEYKDVLICLIKDNPSPIKINLSCKGAEPRVEVEPDIIDFEKLIINQTLPKQIKLKNTSEVNCKWQLSGINSVPPQFKFDATSGVVEKGKEQIIIVTFCSDKQEKFNFNLTLDIEDNLNYGIKMPPRNIKVSAEAFKVNVDLIINSENKIIDFGNVKVRDYKSFPFLLKNLGIYKIKYKFEINKKFWQELFKFEPNEGEIDPGKERNILACFLPYPRDINISPAKNGTEIKLAIYEGEKNIKDQEIPIFINVASYFSKYTINPLKVINYGSMQFNDSATRSIEIRNEGQFDFVYEIMEYLEEAKMIKLKEEKDQKEIEEQKQKELEMKEALENLGSKNPKAPSKKPAAPAQNKADEKNKKKGEENLLKINRFSISNFKGVIAPGSSAKVDILFQAESNKLYNTCLAIDIQGRQPDDNPLGIPFDLVAESCIPSIETKDFDNIFEEQTVLPSLNPEINRQSIITSSIYGIEERVFWFGTVIASKSRDGVVERFKIINSNKIPCTVKISVKPRTNSKSEGFAFEVLNKSVLKIYPNESEYVSVIFKPTNVIPYSALFEAIVEGGESNPESGVLRFELRGEGTLPTLVLEQPQEFSDDGSGLLRFKKTRISKYNINQIQLKNDGKVPATVKFEPIGNDCFTFLSQTTATIQPKSYQSFEIRFEPKSASIEKAVLLYKTLFNPYENPKITLVGEGYFESIAFENLQVENELNYGDVCIGNSKTIVFDMNNQSDSPYKFFWLNNLEPCLEIMPSAGVILPKTIKTITAVFSGKEPVKYSQKDLMVELKQIKFTNNVEDWDTTMKYTKKVTQTEYNMMIKKREEEKLKRKEEIEGIITSLSGAKKPAIDNKKAAAADKNKKKEEEANAAISKSPVKEEANIDIDEILPEPAYTIVDKTEKYITLKLTAVSDYAKYQCTTRQVRFKPTMMYGSRKHDFHIKNTSALNINYNFVFTNPNNQLNPNSVDPGPFTISPKQGVIPANSDEIFLIRFSPTEVDDLYFKRILTCYMKDLDPNLKDLQLELSGEAERPICHFELQEGIKHENGYTYVEIESIGMQIKNTKRFFVLNPTNQGYEFEWEQTDEENLNSKLFKCLTPKGVIYSGKKFEMIFEYTPNTLETHESFWNFKINTEKLSHKFLFHGIAREPMILFNQGKISFAPLLLGGRVKEVIEIINEEHLPYKFSFDKDSIKGNNMYGDSLIVSPIVGTLQPKSSTKIEVTFMPRVEKEFNYNLILRVKQRLKPLTLNVKGIGYTISHGVFLDNKPELKLMPRQEHVMDFGEFFVNEKRERSIILENNGSFNFHFMFKKNGAEYLKITPDSGTVKKNMTISLTILPLKKINLQNHKIVMQIVSGPTYTFLLNAKARTPSIIFSTVSCNFGPCYVMRQPTPVTQLITVKNMDKEALTIETNFESKNKSYLDVQLSTGQVILPYTNGSDILEIPIVFIPREITKYRDVIKFTFNGIYDVDVEVTGEGIPMKVELEDTLLQNLNFGIIQLGQNKKLDFNVINRGKIKADVQIYAENPISLFKRCISFPANFNPEKIYSLEPKGNLKIDMLFNPNIRIPQFTEDIMIKINQTEIRKLLTLSGASYGVDVKIVGDIPPFGTVVVNSMTIRQVLIRNFGDLPAKFKFEAPNPKKDYSKFFTFSPNSGVIAPHDEVNLDIIFHPKTQDNNITFEKIKCLVENFEPLLINLYGRSIDVPKDSVFEKRIETEVRLPITTEIKIKNNSDKFWRIIPSIMSNNEQYVSYFKGDLSFEIKPNIEGTYVLTYLPLTMSKTGNNSNVIEHEATVFFPLPDGTAKVHKIIGISNPPKPKKTIAETAKAREWKIIKLDVSNWLYTTQRFKVTWAVDKNDPTVFIKGANTIDIASNATKAYKLSFRSWKEGNFSMTINFENTETKEYVFFIIQMTVNPADPYPLTELAGTVREVVSGMITISNPLKTPIQIQSSQIICDNEYVTIKPNNFKIIPESEIPIELSYRPLVVGQLNASITIKSPELGDLKYPLLLKGTPTSQIKTLNTISACLGSDKIVSFSFMNFLKKPTTYAVKIEKYLDTMPLPIDFIPDQAIINVQPGDPIKGTEIVSTLRFEPYFIGESKAILRVTSPEGGEYNWVLIGNSFPPQAQGPIKIPLGKNFDLEFKNPLNEAADISVRFDNPNFILGGKLNNKIEPKKPMKIPISYKPTQDNNNTGRLIITLNKLPSWIFYLQAE